MASKATTCEIISASERASEWKKSFVCVNDSLHQAMTESPLAIFIYVIVVFLIMFLVQRAARPSPNTLKKKKNQKNTNRKKNRRRSADYILVSF